LPQTSLGEFPALPDLAGFGGPTFKGGEGRGREENKGRERVCKMGRKREGGTNLGRMGTWEGRQGHPQLKFLATPLIVCH